MAVPKIEIIPALELPGALLNYAFREEEAEDRIKSSPEIIRWRSEVEGEISPFLSWDVEHLFRSHLVYSLLIGLTIKEGLQTPEELIQWLEPGQTERLRRLFFDYFKLPPDGSTEVDKDALSKAIAERGELSHLSVAEEAQLALYAMENPAGFMQRLRLVLSEFYGDFVKPYLEKARDFLEKKRQEHQRLLRKDGRSFLDQISLDNYKSLYGKKEAPRLILTYFANRFISLNTFGLGVLIYGFDVEQLLSDVSMTDRVDEYLKALADPKRTEVLRLLKRRQWYGKELADHFSVSTATMSYHLEKLLSARLIRFEGAERHKILYNLNRSGVEEMIESLRRNLL